jgi:hypothetical protein
MSDKPKQGSTNIAFKRPKVKIADKDELDRFWQQVRHYYRSGEKQPEHHPATVQSLFRFILDQEQSPYPFRIDAAKAIEFCPEMPLVMLEQILVEYEKNNKKVFMERLQSLLAGVQKMVKIDPETKADQMQKTYGFAETMLAFDRLAEIIPGKSRKAAMAEHRTQRLRSVIHSLSKGIRAFQEQQAIMVMDEKCYRQFATEQLMEKVHLIKPSNHDPFEQIHDFFSGSATGFTKLLKAYRIALLEVEDKYEEEIHDEYFSHFNWHHLFDHERALFPPLIVIVQYEEIIKNLGSFSRLMASNRPVKTIVIRNDMISSGSADISWDDAARMYRQELSAFAIANRNTFTFQFNAAYPEYL